MIKRTLEISREPAYLAVRDRQLLLKRGGQTVASIPCEDLGFVAVDHPQTTYSHAALTTLLEEGAVLLLCGRDHLPAGLLLPLSEHHQVVWRLHSQIDASLPLKKRLWQQLVRGKILAQAANLDPDGAAARQLLNLARAVRSGDPANCEAQAARIYWANWLLQGPQTDDSLPFRRDPDQPGINALLNYGYAVLRAALARALVSGGLQPAIGVHHSNRANAFCLADDLIEPLRPLVDARARALAFDGHDELTQPAKAELLDLLTLEVATGDFRGPLLVALHRYVASFVRVLDGQAKRLEIPVPCNSAVTAPCG
jgi:CRISPR-associated protein Cas1